MGHRRRLSSDVLGYGTIRRCSGSGVVLFLVIAIMSQCTIFTTRIWLRVAQLLGFEDNLFPRFIRKVRSRGSQPLYRRAHHCHLIAHLLAVRFTTIIEMNIIFILARYMFLGFIVLSCGECTPAQDRPATCSLSVAAGGRASATALAFSTPRSLCA